MKAEYIFPVILIVEQIGAAIVYGSKRDLWSFLYWIFAAAVNFSVVFKKITGISPNLYKKQSKPD